MTTEEKIINNLFNDKRMEEYIKKYNKNLILNSKAKDSIKIWMEKLDNNELEDEVANYLNFFEYILEDLLGYPITDIKHELNIGNEGRPVEFTLKKGNVDYVVVELKGTKHKDLTKKMGLVQTPVQQATNYASAKKETKWAIVSNYDEFRFFDPSARDSYISFKFRQLKNEKILKKFLLIFSKFSLIDEDIPTILLTETKIIERKLEDEFYQLYSETRLMLIKELEHSSETIDKLEAIRLAQLILNRFIFLCFAEDILLIPSETIADVLLTPIKHKNLFEFTMWDRLNELFRFVDKGNEERRIHAFNGGLFEENLRNLEIRDKIDDVSFFDDCRTTWTFNDKYEDIEKLLGVYKDTLNPIYKNMLTISSFDFGSELSVNILGHIFENSISDIEELKDDTIEKRKKDGVFYTPEYITDYICRNAILSFLSKDGTSKSILDLINEYESTNSLDELDYKLKNIKILDPACGSGSILNKAVDILLDIHETYHEIKYANDQSLNPFIDNLENRKQIISNNIFGVDLNDESVEITKLSLFLKLATTSGIKQGFKLPNLDKNIKCGNSVIDSKEYDDNAFNWEVEFEDIMNDGGFDVIVGNPPYVRQELIKEIKPYLKETYATYKGTADLYIYFFEKSLKMLTERGVFSVICSSKFSKAGYGELLRDFIIKNYNINLYEDYSGEKLFEDATTYPCIIQITNEKTEDNEIFVDRKYFMKQKRLTKKSWVFKPEQILQVKDKIDEGKPVLKEKQDLNIYRGLTTGLNEAFVISDEIKKELIEKDVNNVNIIKPVLRGRDIKKWQNSPKLHILLTKNGVNVETEYPIIFEHLNQFEEKMKKRQDQGEHWTNLRNCAYYDDFEKPKLVYPQMVQSCYATYDENGFYLLNSAFMITSTGDDKDYLKALSAILSSNVMDFYIRLIVDVLQGQTYSMKKLYVDQLPIANLNNENKLFLSNLVDDIQTYHNEFYKEKIKFIDWVKRTFDIENYPQKAEEFYKMTFEDLFIELEKKRKIPKMNNQELLKEQFNDSSYKMSNLEIKIRQLENDINKKVYELYDLTPIEIKLIENYLV